MQEAVAGQPLVEPLQLLLEPRAERGADGEADPGADVAEVAEVVVEPLQLQVERAQGGGAVGIVDAGHGLDCLAVGDGVGAGAGAADALGELQHLRRCLPLGQFFDAAMGVEEARLQMEDRLADGGEAEMPRLDHPGVDRPDRDLDDAFAVQRVEAVRLARRPRGTGTAGSKSLRSG